jgi:hypothetical protein
MTKRLVSSLFLVTIVSSFAVALAGCGATTQCARASSPSGAGAQVACAEQHDNDRRSDRFR